MIRERALPLSREGAEDLAIRALAFLAEEPEELVAGSEREAKAKSKK